MDKLKQKTVLITGGAGFIGSHLCDYFINNGDKVICVDSFFSGKKKNIEHLIKNKNFVLIKHNIIYPLRKNFDKIDEIYNLACPASPQQYQFDPILTLRTSVDGMRNMLEMARKYNAKILQASTSEIYGDPLENPQKESYFGNVDCLGKRSCYDEGKRAAESLCKDYNLQYGTDVRIVRLFNIYGPKMMFNDGRVMSNFILQSFLGENITVHGEGQQSRSFMYISDLIKAFVKIMEASKEKIGIGPINLGNPDERSIKSLAEDIKKRIKSRSKIIYIDYKEISERFGDPQQRCPDISKAKELLGWSPEIDFDFGVEKTIEDFKARLKEKTRIIIFAPTYLPLEGPAEKAVKKITNRLIGYDFDLFTTKFKKEFPKKEKINRVNIYRIGFGNKFDKYLLPFLATWQALKLHKKNRYEAVWGIMASYGSLAGIIFSLFSKTAFLVSLYEGKISEKKFLRKKILNPFYKIIFKRANHLQIATKLTDQQLAWAQDEKGIRTIDLDKGWDYVSKKTKEEFQELEILTSRL
ncbi:MAG: UDP-glucuronic acid decarboxylase family protein [Patescibacteria group bacterium]|nr:UDP-glucuronic acid decarboxylase family protein [Patescibacteria group bacterium]